jgi:uncharacterized protein (TIGR02117 family)
VKTISQRVKIAWQTPVILLTSFLAALSIYMQMALTLSLIAVNRQYHKTEKAETEIYIVSNGVHLDLVLPFRNQMMDWNKNLEPDDRIVQQVTYISFGWGDRAFYLDTPEWSDLTFTTAFNALFMNQPSALHVSYFSSMEESKNCIKIGLTKEQYVKLVNYIRSEFSIDSTGAYCRIVETGYEKFDQFYEAQGSYSLFFTCNTWTNRALRRSELRACLWTPFDKGILWQYRRKKANHFIP